MFTLVILMRENGQVTLIYEHEDHADRDFDRVSQLRAELAENSDVPKSIVLLIDDFGTRAEIDAIDICSHTLQNVKRCNDGAVALQLAQHRAQAQLGQMIRSDPQLKFLAPQGPLVG